jgi:hypothetical protein
VAGGQRGKFELARFVGPGHPDFSRVGVGRAHHRAGHRGTIGRASDARCSECGVCACNDWGGGRLGLVRGRRLLRKTRGGKRYERSQKPRSAACNSSPEFSWADGIAQRRSLNRWNQRQYPDWTASLRFALPARWCGIVDELDRDRALESWALNFGCDVKLHTIGRELVRAGRRASMLALLDRD